MSQPSLRRNIPLFIAFRLLFNARFYYPVLGVLFMDLGLSLEQYALLNAVWAVTIILLEIPSGALADLIGRKRMVVSAGVLMILEMLIFALAPVGAALFPCLIANRILSGAAEACASGADEALAYDSLTGENRDDQWSRILASLMRWSSGAFFFAMILGAVLYDGALLETLSALIGVSFVPAPGQTIRWPVYLTLVTAVLATGTALLLREPPSRTTSQPSVSGAVRNITQAAAFVFARRNIVLLIAAGILFDSSIRLFLTFGSNYYRLIELPVFANGLLGSVFGLLGFAAAGLARLADQSLRPGAVAGLLGTTLFLGLLGACAATPLWGVWVMIPLGLVMPMAQFFLSKYLNAWTTSDLRATVLSFRGIALNLGYGLAGVLFAGGANLLRHGLPHLDENALFARSLWFLPAGFLAGFCFLALLARRPTGHPAQ